MEPVRLDTAKNRIHIRFDGFMNADRAQQLPDAYRDAIARAHPRFAAEAYLDEA
jgi:hypothetical protein